MPLETRRNISAPDGVFLKCPLPLFDGPLLLLVEAVLRAYTFETLVTGAGDTKYRPRSYTAKNVMHSLDQRLNCVQKPAVVQIRAF